MIAPRTVTAVAPVRRRPPHRRGGGAAGGGTDRPDAAGRRRRVVAAMEASTGGETPLSVLDGWRATSGIAYGSGTG